MTFVMGEFVTFFIFYKIVRNYMMLNRRMDSCLIALYNFRGLLFDWVTSKPNDSSSTRYSTKRYTQEKI